LDFHCFRESIVVDNLNSNQFNPKEGLRFEYRCCISSSV
jgi:hypothetical protein